jgi:hypothetical protein
VRAASAELVDGAPRALESDVISDEAKQLKSELSRRFPGASVRLRETGRVLHAEVNAAAPKVVPDLTEIWPGDAERAWRFAQLGFVHPPSPKAAQRSASSRRKPSHSG